MGLKELRRHCHEHYRSNSAYYSHMQLLNKAPHKHTHISTYRLHPIQTRR